MCDLYHRNKFRITVLDLLSQDENKPQTKPDVPSDDVKDSCESLTIDDLKDLVKKQSLALEDSDEKLKHCLADFDNLQKKTATDIRMGINNQTDRLFLDFLQIYDDFMRAKDAYGANSVDTGGLDSILKNMDSFLLGYDVRAIDALGEIFDPNFHEAISVISDPALDDGTITKEIRKGYISNNRVIRPVLVEISKRD